MRAVRHREHARLLNDPARVPSTTEKKRNGKEGRTCVVVVVVVAAGAHAGEGERGDERAALQLAERQRRLAPEHVMTLNLLMRALHINGKRVAAEATRQRALDLYPDCDRFKFPLDNGSM